MDRELGRELAEVGRTVRDVVRAGRTASDHLVVRTEGGDDVYGIDARADEVLIEQLRRRCGERWPGGLVIEGFDDPVPIGDAGPWTYLADPVDGTRGLLAGLRSAWVLLGAGEGATSLRDLGVGRGGRDPDRSRMRWGRSPRGPRWEDCGPSTTTWSAAHPARPAVLRAAGRRRPRPQLRDRGPPAPGRPWADRRVRRRGARRLGGLRRPLPEQRRAAHGGRRRRRRRGDRPPARSCTPAGSPHTPTTWPRARWPRRQGSSIESLPAGPLRARSTPTRRSPGRPTRTTSVAELLRPRIAEACRRRGLVR